MAQKKLTKSASWGKDQLGDRLEKLNLWTDDFFANFVLVGGINLTPFSALDDLKLNLRKYKKKHHRARIS